MPERPELIEGGKLLRPLLSRTWGELKLEAVRAPNTFLQAVYNLGVIGAWLHVHGGAS